MHIVNVIIACCFIMYMCVVLGRVGESNAWNSRFTEPLILWFEKSVSGLKIFISAKRESFLPLVCLVQPDLARKRNYFKLVANSLILYENMPFLKRGMKPNPTPKPNHHWGISKSYLIVQMSSYEFATKSNSYELPWDCIGSILKAQLTPKTIFFSNLLKSFIFFSAKSLY